eukprot:s1350_g15.t2
MDASGTADTDLLGASAALAGLAGRDPSGNNTRDVFVNNMKDLVDELQDHIHSSIHPHQDLARQTEQEYLDGLYGSFQTCRDELYASLADAGKQNSSVSLGRAAHVRCRSEQAQAKTSLAVCEAAKQDLAKADECTAWPVMQVTSIPDAGSVCSKTAETYEAYLRRMKEHWDDELSKYESIKAPSDCSKEETGLESKKLECDGAQSTFERGFCDQAVQVNKAWYKYIVCYRAAKSSYEDATQTAKKIVFSKKHDAEAALRECKLMDHSSETEKIQVQLQKVPEAETPPPSASIPGDAAFAKEPSETARMSSFKGCRSMRRYPEHCRRNTSTWPARHLLPRPVPCRFNWQCEAPDQVAAMESWQIEQCRLLADGLDEKLLQQRPDEVLCTRFGAELTRRHLRCGTVFAPSMLRLGGLEPAGPARLSAPKKHVQVAAAMPWKASIGDSAISARATVRRAPSVRRKVWDAASFCSDPLVACVGWAALLSGITVLRVAMDDDEDTPKSFLKKRRRMPMRKLRQDSAPIVCLGDSITRGNLSTDWVSSLREELNQGLVLNAGINMQCSQNIQERIGEVIQCKPSHVTVLVGTNDLKAALSPVEGFMYQVFGQLPEVPSLESYERTLRDIKERLIDAGANVALDHQSEANKRAAEFASVVRKVAESGGKMCTYLPLFEMTYAALPKGRLGRPYCGMNFFAWCCLLCWDMHILQRDPADIQRERNLDVTLDLVHLGPGAAKGLADMVQSFVRRAFFPTSGSTMSFLHPPRHACDHGRVQRGVSSSRNSSQDVTWRDSMTLWLLLLDISRVLQFKHSPDALENIRDWVQEDITDWAPQGEQALRRHIVTLMYGDDDDEKIRAVRVYTDVCEMQMMLGSHLFADEAQAMQTNPGIAAVLHQLHIGTDDQDAYGLADAELVMLREEHAIKETERGRAEAAEENLASLKKQLAATKVDHKEFRALERAHGHLQEEAASLRVSRGSLLAQLEVQKKDSAREIDAINGKAEAEASALRLRAEHAETELAKLQATESELRQTVAGLIQGREEADRKKLSTVGPRRFKSRRGRKSSTKKDSGSRSQPMQTKTSAGLDRSTARGRKIPQSVCSSGPSAVICISLGRFRRMRACLLAAIKPRLGRERGHVDPMQWRHTTWARELPNCTVACA